jgi:hypothetical protein
MACEHYCTDTGMFVLMNRNLIVPYVDAAGDSCLKHPMTFCWTSSHITVELGVFFIPAEIGFY